MATQPSTDLLQGCLQNWGTMSRWQQASLVVNYVASVFIVLVALFPEPVHRFISIRAGRSVNPMYVIVFLAILIFAMNTSFVVPHEDLF